MSRTGATTFGLRHDEQLVSIVEHVSVGRRGLFLRRVLRRMVLAILVGRLDDHGQSRLNGHAVGIRDPLDVFVGDVCVRLTHVVVGGHAATVETHRFSPSCGPAASHATRTPAVPAWTRARPAIPPPPTIYLFDRVPTRPRDEGHAARNALSRCLLYTSDAADE